MSLKDQPVHRNANIISDIPKAKSVDVVVAVEDNISGADKPKVIEIAANIINIKALLDFQNASTQNKANNRISKNPEKLIVINSPLLHQLISDNRRKTNLKRLTIKLC